MRALLLLLALVLASCAKVEERPCEQMPDGLLLYVGPHSTEYRDIVEALRRRAYDEIIRSAGSRNVQPKAHGPGVCKTGQPFSRSLNVTFSPRRDQDVWAAVDLYFSEDDEVAVAEFYVVPLAP